MNYHPTKPLTDEERRELEAALDKAQHRPWQVVSGKDMDHRDWLLAFGEDDEGMNWYLTTYNLHASRTRASDCVADVTACALAVNAVPRLLAEIDELRKKQR